MKELLVSLVVTTAPVVGLLAGSCEMADIDDKMITYDCCGGEKTLSETLTAPITCDDEECGTGRGKLLKTREGCEDFESPVVVNVTGSCRHGCILSNAVTVALEKVDPSDLTPGAGGIGRTSAAGQTETAERYENVRKTRETSIISYYARLGVLRPGYASRYVPKGAPNWGVSLGGNASGALSGRLKFEPARLFNPNLKVLDSSLLTLAGGNESGLDVVQPFSVEVVTNSAPARTLPDGSVVFGTKTTYSVYTDRSRFLGIRAKDCYAAFSSPTGFPFSVSFYRPDDLEDGLSSDGGYVPKTNATPFAACRIGYGDRERHAQAFEIRTSMPGEDDDSVELYYDAVKPSTDIYGISRDGGNWRREVQTTAAEDGRRLVSEVVRTEDGYRRAEDLVYGTAGGRDVLLSRARTCDGKTFRDVYGHYDDGKLKSHLAPSGLLTEYAYDGQGRETCVRTTSPDGRVEETVCSYDPVGVRPHVPDGADGTSDDDGETDPGTPRVETRSVDGVAVSKTLRFVALDTMGHRIVEEVRLADPVATDLTNEWESAENVRTYVDYMPYSNCKPCSKLPSLVMHEDGRIDRYAYSAGEYEPGPNGAAGVFTDSGIGEGDWFRTVVTHYAAGDVEVPNVTTRDVKIEIRSSKKTRLQEQ